MSKTVTDLEHEMMVAARRYALARNTGVEVGAAWKRLEKCWRAVVHAETIDDIATTTKRNAERVAA